MPCCNVCGQAGLESRLDFGPQPVSSHFKVEPGSVESRYDLGLGICERCGVVQLLSPFPHQALVSPYDWFTYREPEGHLDDLTATIASLPGIRPEARILGVSVKDQTTLDRFVKLGFAAPKCLRPHDDLGIVAANAGIEHVQRYLTAERASDIARRYGGADIVIARHILEHAEDVKGFLAALVALLADDGYLVLEVPDCLRNMMLCDITMVWEEHSVFFTPETFRMILSDLGMEETLFRVYPLVFEDCLILIGRKGHQHVRSAGFDNKIEETRRAFADFAANFSLWKSRYRSYLERYVRETGPVALYGAGHLSCAFTNLYKLADLITCVVDDTPQKQGLYLAGTDIPILSSSNLLSKSIRLCLLGLSPESEEKVLRNNMAFTAAGGRFRSLFAASTLSLRSDMAG